MSTQDTLFETTRDGIPFVGIMVLWIVVTAIVYGGFLLVWPPISGAEPWIYVGVYLFPVVGFLGHTLGQVLKSSG